MTAESRQVSVFVDRSADDVYRFTRSPANLPRWAAGISTSVEQVDGQWVTESPFGRVVIAFAPENEFGILDHRVTTASGEVFDNPMRVVPVGPASAEVVFTVRRAAAATDEQFAADVSAVQNDLETLKNLLER